ncbi:DUF433 domain-containing protein [Leptolyngbya sp. NIES-2104]|uniref:DUF433 domain-containing protein n=1 Tax=Leptolyngbya sp. NIES-2104 TaxID=1552121 RepID=UPI0006ECA6E6|nr:DUF433 domain-containing protein [Leptolyngbya sp. NIES-2104]GAP99695.1 DUF433 domain-containing protein [Leptolyngbya sp. NIES-2104]
MSLQDLQTQLLALSPAEKTQAIQLLIESLSDTWTGIEKTLGVCGGDARITNTRIPVWVLVRAKQLGNTDAQILTNYPTITATDLSNAWRYAEAHLGEIEQAIAENEAA